MTIKYEPVFGDQSLFDNAPEDAVAVRVNNYQKITLYFLTSEELSSKQLRELHAIPIVAMRRIIKTPTWSRADQEAGVLPPVGCKYLAGSDNLELECLYNDATGNVWGFDSEGAVSGYALGYCHPIETPEEKAARLKYEWCKTTSTKCGNMLGLIYDALLSGELKAPTND